MADEDDEADFGGLYENGHWIWDDSSDALVYVSDLPPKPIETVKITSKAVTGAIEFRDDIDLVEQVRFRRRYQRKLAPGEAAIITLQDIKDIVLYTAPVHILSPTLINMLHLSTTERFLRALILCSAYYLQVADEMAYRILELEIKVRTQDCEKLEREFSNNLSDLRLLVAKEYCVMLIGGADTKKFHHMGPLKKRRSLSDKDARLMEIFIRMSVQIVWIALGRRGFHQIELETNRICKSETFNVVEHTLKTGYISKMAPEERAVLLGRCVRHDKKLTTRSPLINEVFCDREIDYRLMGLGVVKYPQMTQRLKYMWHAVAGDENDLKSVDVSLGIIGMPRSRFDTMLTPLPDVTEHKASASSRSMVKQIKSDGEGSTTSKGSVKKSTMAALNKALYPEIKLPSKESPDIYFPSSFPDETEAIIQTNNIQRRRWLNRLTKLVGAK